MPHILRRPDADNSQRIDLTGLVTINVRSLSGLLQRNDSGFPQEFLGQFRSIHDYQPRLHLVHVVEVGRLRADLLRNRPRKMLRRVKLPQ